MALTPRGASITDKHRRRAVAMATRADSRLRRAWSRLDLENLDAGRAAFQKEIGGVLLRYYELEAETAQRLLAQYRLAELGTPSGPVVRPPMDLAGSIASVDRAAVVGTKARIAQGVPDTVAFERARREMMAEAHRIMLAGSRGTIIESAAADSRAIGWRRVSDGDPCAFCALLVSRGPAYLSEAKALKNANAPSGWVGKYGNKDPYHPNCGCSVEPVYGDWQPTETEQGYIDAYFEAAEAVSDDGLPRTAQTVLPRMREDGEFKDSPARRVRTTDAD